MKAPSEKSEENLYAEFFTRLLGVSKQSSMDRLVGIEGLRDYWRSLVVEKYGMVPDLLEEKLSEGDEAFQSLNRIVKMLSLPDDNLAPIDWAVRGRDLLKEKEFEKSFQAFKKSIAQSVPDVETLTLAGTAALHCGRLDYAEEYADQALLIDDKSLRATMLKGLVLYNQNNFERAIQYFESGQEINPSSKTVSRYLDQANEQLKLQNDNASFNSTSDPRAKRRWVRRPCELNLVINDHEQMWPISMKVKSLSAGGCLVELPEEFKLAEEFSFELELGSHKGRIHGSGRKIYATDGRVAGIRFCELSPDHEDRINQQVISMA